MDGEKIKATLAPLVEEGKLDAGFVDELHNANTSLYARTKQAEDDVAKLKTENAALRVPAPAVPPTPPPAPQSSVDLTKVLQLRSEGYSDAEVLRLSEYSKRMNMPIDEVAKDPFIKSGIEGERARVKAENGTPAPSSRGVRLPANATPEQKAQARDPQNWKSNRK